MRFLKVSLRAPGSCTVFISALKGLQLYSIDMGRKGVAISGLEGPFSLGCRGFARGMK